MAGAQYTFAQWMNVVASGSAGVERWGRALWIGAYNHPVRADAKVVVIWGMSRVPKTGRRVEGEMGEETWIKGVQGGRCVWREASNNLALLYLCCRVDRGQRGWVAMPTFKGWTELEKENATDGWILNKIKYRNLIDSGMQNWFDERAAPLWTIKWKGRCVGLFKNLFSGSPECVVARREEWTWVERV